MGTLRAPTSAPRRRGAGAVLVAALAACALLSACGPGVPEASDPLAGASTGTVPLPANVGPADCRPASPSHPMPDGATEIQGAAASRVALWAKIDAGTPAPRGVAFRMIWRIPGASQLRLLAIGPDGERVEPTLVMPVSAPAWARPGDAWTSTFVLPSPGCWRVNAQRGEIHGDVWFQVG